ncbi:Thioredoxin domain-containing protein 6 [Anthophora retusa]
MARMGRKEATALQIEIETEEDWEQLKSRKGLVLADVYSEWCGPCIAMVSTLRNVKMEIGGDLITYAIVKNNHIADLERFRGRSEPVWMFLEDGKMVNLMFGANCPQLRKLLVKEIKRVQNNEEPEMSLDASTRTPEEEAWWQEKEAIRLAIEEHKRAKEEAERREKYEAFLAQMMFELSEETALVFYPWVFTDEEGRYRDKFQSPPYVELVHTLFKQNYDVSEELRVYLTEEMIEKMFVESDVEITPELIAGYSLVSFEIVYDTQSISESTWKQGELEKILYRGCLNYFLIFHSFNSLKFLDYTLSGFTDGRTIAMRLKGRRPHADWPVPYPYECPKGTKRCPTRQINDVEEYLVHLITSTKPLIAEEVPPPPSDSTFMERYVYVHEPDTEEEEDFARIHPAIWVPPQARSKVHVYTTLFSNYMELVHPYEEPVPPPPYCAFKFHFSKFDVVRETYSMFPDAIEYFGAFEFDKPPIARRIASTPEDFERKAKYQTGNEVFVIIIRRISEDAFLSFASIGPYFVQEDDEKSEAMIDEYFPEGAEDVILEEFDESDEEEESYGEEEAEEEEDEDEKDEEHVDTWGTFT